MEILTRFNAFFNPEQFQGRGKTKKYFEGWYFKVVHADETRAFAFIPGIAMDEKGNKQAFVQVLDGKKKTAAYHKFDAALFKPARNKFLIGVDQNSFSERQLILNLPGVKGELKFFRKHPMAQTVLLTGNHGTLCFCTVYGMLSWHCKYGSPGRRRVNN